MGILSRKLKASQRTLRGMTLVEMLMAIAVMGIVLQGFSYLFLRSWDTNKFIMEEGLASTSAQRATNQILIQLRGVKQADNGAYPIVSGDDFDLTIYADIDSDGSTERVHYFLDLPNDQMKRGVTEPDTSTLPVSYPSGDQVVDVLANYVVNESDNPVFYYYNDDYPGDTTNNPLGTPISVGGVQLIRVKLLVNIDPVHAPNNVNIESFVDLRNLHNYE